MPEIEITSEQQSQISEWISNKNGSWIRSFDNRIIGSGAYKVDDQPLVVEGVLTHNNEYPVKFYLTCTDQHAKELQEAGIVKFPPQGQISLEEDIERR